MDKPPPAPRADPAKFVTPVTTFRASECAFPVHEGTSREWTGMAEIPWRARPRMAASVRKQMPVAGRPTMMARKKESDIAARATVCNARRSISPDEYLSGLLYKVFDMKSE